MSRIRDLVRSTERREKGSGWWPRLGTLLRRAAFVITDGDRLSQGVGSPLRRDNKNEMKGTVGTPDLVTVG